MTRKEALPRTSSPRGRPELDHYLGVTGDATYSIITDRGYVDIGSGYDAESIPVFNNYTELYAYGGIDICCILQYDR